MILSLLLLLSPVHADEPYIYEYHANFQPYHCVRSGGSIVIQAYVPSQDELAWIRIMRSHIQNNDNYKAGLYDYEEYANRRYELNLQSCPISQRLWCWSGDYTTGSILQTLSSVTSETKNSFPLRVADKLRGPVESNLNPYWTETQELEDRIQKYGHESLGIYVGEGRVIEQDKFGYIYEAMWEEAESVMSPADTYLTFSALSPISGWDVYVLVRNELYVLSTDSHPSLSSVETPCHQLERAR